MMYNKKLIAGAIVAATAAAFSLSAQAGEVNKITGAGSSFAYPIISKWAAAYKKTTGVEVNYQSVGSGAGIKQIIANTVDFGASDDPMTVEDLEKNGLTQWPLIMGGEVIVANIPGNKQGMLTINGPVLADIMMGKITKWNDPALEKLNPGKKLPDLDITVVHRSDASGTTAIFTNYLSKVSPEWKEKVGEGKTVNWLSKGNLGGKGNEGVASYTGRIKGAIGYVEYAYALQNKLPYMDMINSAGKRVAPTMEIFAAAASHADWEHTPAFRVVLTDQPGDDSWPITGSTFAIVHKNPENPAQVKAVLDFFKWSMDHGQSEAKELHYIPIPASVEKLIEASWAENVKLK
ncbi:MAG: phosphate ABC transporter substrate-binding protein PstS [Halothiobacillus sp.]|jgi:phosphate transport system substrate-binding protein|nr:phosphate ABC transporter substrate-binding protein PstS [Halothiobacillus sp.]